MFFLTKVRCVVFFILISSIVFSQPIGYSFGKHISVSSSSVSGGSDLINFPLLISLTDTDLRTVANSGKVESSNGYDILFTLADCNTILDHQIEKYDPVTGEYVVWVKLPKLSVSETTNFHLYYGNSSVTTDPSLASTFNANYEACWHMNNDPSTSLLLDYTVNNINGTSSGAMTSADLIDGKIGKAIDFDGSNDYFALANKSYVGTETISNLTISAWIKTNFTNTSQSGNWSILDFDRSEYFNIYIHGDGRFSFSTKSIGTSISDSYAGTSGDLNDNTWHYVTAVYDGTNKYLYVDGQLSLTVSSPHAGLGLGHNITRFGFIGEGSEASTFNGGRNNKYYKGQYDEIRFLEHSLSSDWIKTEYDNQNNPSSFYSIGPEETATDLCAIALDARLNYFEVNKVNQDVYLEWETLSETNNSHFIIERSIDSKNWKSMQEIPGAGNSVATIKYVTIDNLPLKETSYYRLRQVDFNGVASVLSVKVLNFKEKNESKKVNIYPNPANNFLNVEIVDGNNEFKIYTIEGIELTSLVNYEIVSNSKLLIDLGVLKKGIYYIKTKQGQASFIKE